ncbi:MAG: HD domain-containing protein [Planctomycetota bacterium]|nr:MAG: HD domain-containing protein [Planctomycetota bacterium]
MTDFRQKILYVEFERDTDDDLCLRLEKKFQIISARNGREGLEKLQSQGPFAVVISNYYMLGMDGSAFLKQAHKIAPQTFLITLTGRAELLSSVIAPFQEDVFLFINKPCLPELVEKTVNEIIEDHQPVTAKQTLSAHLMRGEQTGQEFDVNLEQQVEERTVTIRRLHQFVSELNGLDSLVDVADLVVKTTAQMLQSRRVSLMLPDAQQKNLTIVSSVGISPNIVQRTSVPVGKPISGLVYSNAKCIVINDVGQMPFNNENHYDTECFASIPLMSMAIDSHHGPIGVLNVTERIDKQGYDEVDIAILTAITESAAVALMNQIRLRERDEARDAVILALAKLAEHRDPETGAHLERVQSYCRLLSETLGQMPKYAFLIDDEFIDAIVRSSPLHDIGKVGVPDQILLKKGSLTEQEYEIMRRHVTIGGDTIKALIEQGRTQGFLKMGMDIAYNHHEKYDGSGYPAGLAGDGIPLPAQILAVADVYDALTSRRPYKLGYGHEAAAAFIREQSGSRFNPDLVEAFVSCQDELKKLSLELSDEINRQSVPEEGRPETDGLEVVTAE